MVHHCCRLALGRSWNYHMTTQLPFLSRARTVPAGRTSLCENSEHIRRWRKTSFHILHDKQDPGCRFRLFV